MQEVEIWKDIEGYEGLYQISSLGRIKSLPKRVNIPKGDRLTNEKIIYANSKRVDGHGYHHFSLSKNGVKKDLKTHRLVAKAFVPNLFNKATVNHKNGIKTDNRASNLEWMTNAENIRHSYTVDGLRDQSFEKRFNRIYFKTPIVQQLEKLIPL